MARNKGAERERASAKEPLATRERSGKEMKRINDPQGRK